LEILVPQAPGRSTNLAVPSRAKDIDFCGRINHTNIRDHDSKALTAIEYITLRPCYHFTLCSSGVPRYRQRQYYVATAKGIVFIVY
jgi:hypothetical protein